MSPFSNYDTGSSAEGMQALRRISLQVNNAAAATAGRSPDECLIKGRKSLCLLRSGEVQRIRKIEPGSVPLDGKDETTLVLDMNPGQAEKITERFGNGRTVETVRIA